MCHPSNSQNCGHPTLASCKAQLGALSFPSWEDPGGQDYQPLEWTNSKNTRNLWRSCLEPGCSLPSTPAVPTIPAGSIIPFSILARAEACSPFWAFIQSRHLCHHKAREVAEKEPQHCQSSGECWRENQPVHPHEPLISHLLWMAASIPKMPLQW